jgi:hypothetical protein
MKWNVYVYFELRFLRWFRYNSYFDFEIACYNTKSTVNKISIPNNIKFELNSVVWGVGVQSWSGVTHISRNQYFAIFLCRTEPDRIPDLYYDLRAHQILPDFWRLLWMRYWKSWKFQRFSLSVGISCYFGLICSLLLLIVMGRFFVLLVYLQEGEIWRLEVVAEK